MNVSFARTGSAIAPVTHAEAILQAWIRRDLPRLREELERSRHLDCSKAYGGNAERLELLVAIADRMIASGALTEAPAADPQIRICVNLLAHLVSAGRSAN